MDIIACKRQEDLCGPGGGSRGWVRAAPVIEHKDNDPSQCCLLGCSQFGEYQNGGQLSTLPTARTSETTVQRQANLASAYREANLQRDQIGNSHWEPD